MKTHTISYDLTKIAAGVDKIANVVKTTLGPAGKNIGIVDGSKIINTKDGVSVAKRVIPLEDDIENYAATLVKKAADQTVEKAGDGTTTTCVLTQAIFHNAISALNRWHFPVSLFCRKLSEQAETFLKGLHPRTLTADDELFKNVINISTNSDAELSYIVTCAFKEVGKDGIITIESSKTNAKTELVKVDGLCFDTGYVSPYFVTDPGKMHAMYEAQHNGQQWVAEPAILIYDGVLNSAEPILHLMEAALQAKRPFVIIAEDIVGECLATMVVNRMRANAPFLAIKSPGYGEAKKDWYTDIALVTGATYIDPRVSDIRECGANILGRCKQLVAQNHETTIVGFDDTNEAIKLHIENLEMFLHEKEDNSYYKEKLEQRIARLRNGVTVIKLASFNDVENQEKSDRLDDAIKAGKAALKEGVVPGCGAALAHVDFPYSEDKIEKLAIEVLAKALPVPMKTILSNLGCSDLEIDAILIGLCADQTVKIENGETQVVDAFEAGVVDPFIVVRTALQEAVAAANILINTAAVIYNNKDNEQKQQF